jgi:hypothetical protein
MAHRVPCAVPVLILMVAITETALAQDYYWESITGEADSTAPAAKTFFAPKKMKFVPAKENDPMLIIRLDRGSVYVINERRKTYAELNFTEWRSMRRQQSAMVFQIPPDVQKLPDDQREQRLHELMADQVNPISNVDVIRTPETKVIRGYVCGKYIVKQDSKVILTVWSTHAIKEFESMREDLKGVYQQLGLNYPAMRYLPDALNSIDGFPLEYQIGEVKTTVQKIEKRIWGEDEFEPPPGFKRTTAAVPGQR